MFKLTLACCLVLLSVSAYSTNFEFHGFLTAGAAILDDDDSIYLGTTDRLSHETDSKIGLQIKNNLDDRLSVIGQVKATGRRDQKAEFEWAFASYTYSDLFTFRAGRMRLPAFLYSAQIDASYTYMWIRPPQEVYVLAPFTGIDAVDVIATGNVGDVFITANSILSATFNDELDFLDGVEILEAKNEDLRGINIRFDWENWAARVVYSTLTVSYLVVELEEFINDILIPAGLPEVAEAIDTKEDLGTVFDGIALMYDDGIHNVIFEYSRITVDSGPLRNQDSFYLAYGRRFGKWQPHITYAQIKSRAAIIPGANDNPIAGLAQSIADGIAATSDSITIGLRYDFNPFAALKLEYQSIDRQEGKASILQDNSILPSLDGGTVNVFSFSVDVLF